MRRIGLAVLAAAMVAPATASAGLVLGLGTGLSKTGGSIAGTDKMGDAASLMIPVELQAGWKFADRLTVAGSATIDYGIVGGDFKASCDAGNDDCLVSQSRVGGQVRWNFMPARRLDPWLGAGMAWEVLAMERSWATGATTTNLQGTAFDLTAGVDYQVSSKFSLSPWLGLSVGRYTESKEVSAVTADWETIWDKKTHSLVTAGVRVAWDFGGTPRADGAPVASP